MLCLRNCTKIFFKNVICFSVSIFFFTNCETKLKSTSKDVLSGEGRLIFDAIINEKFKSSKASGLAVGLVVGNQTYTQTLGFSDVSDKKEFCDTTIFCAGILSESVTASLALALCYHKKVNVEIPIVDVLNHFSLNSDSYKSITLKNLLTQTSGVPKLSVLWDDPNMGDSALYATTWSIRLLQPEFIPPGSKVVRSAYNFDIAADFIEHLSGMKLNEFAQKYLFKPLEMSRSSFSPFVDFEKDVSKPHYIADWLSYDFRVLPDYPLNGEHAGSIGWHTTIADAVKWMSMLVHEGRFGDEIILPARIAKIMTTPLFKTSQSGDYMGIGLEAKSIKGANYFYKTGVVGGFEHSLILIPSLNIGVMVVTNSISDFQTLVFAQELIGTITQRSIPKYKASVHYQMGKVFKETNSIDSALIFFRDNKNSPLYDCTELALSQFGANLYYRLGYEDAALKIFSKCVEWYPKSAYAHLNLAEYYVSKLNIGEAEKQIKFVIELSAGEFDIEKRVVLVKKTIELIKEKELYEKEK